MLGWIKRLAWWRAPRLGDVFTPSSPARQTYVPRTVQEGDLRSALSQVGTQIIIYGESGAGKSSMAIRVLEAAGRKCVITQCDANSSYTDILTSAFFQANELVRISHKRTDESELALHGLLGGKKAQAGSKSSWKTGREDSFAPVVQAPITAEHLAKALGRRNLSWIIEDFHKVGPETRLSLTHALKTFSDKSITNKQTAIIVLGAADTPTEVWGSQANMGHRIAAIALPPLQQEELKQILDTGAELLNVDFSGVCDEIIRHSVGIASVTHALAYGCCEALGVTKRSLRTISVTPDALETAKLQYARMRSPGIRHAFDAAMTVSRSRKYDNCALILRALAAFGEAGATHAELLASVRQLSDMDYPSGNLTTYLKKLQTEERGEVVRRTSTNQIRFSTPLMHTYAQIIFGLGQTNEFWPAIEASDEDRAMAAAALTASSSQPAELTTPRSIE